MYALVDYVDFKNHRDLRNHNDFATRTNNSSLTSTRFSYFHYTISFNNKLLYLTNKNKYKQDFKIK